MKSAESKFSADEGDLEELTGTEVFSFIPGDRSLADLEYLYKKGSNKFIFRRYPNEGG